MRHGGRLRRMERERPRRVDEAALAVTLIEMNLTIVGARLGARAIVSANPAYPCPWAGLSAKAVVAAGADFPAPSEFARRMDALSDERNARRRARAKKRRAGRRRQRGS